MNAVLAAHVAEQRAREALRLATSARIDAQRDQRHRRIQAQDMWLNQQVERAKPAERDFTETIEVRKAVGLVKVQIKWDVIVLTDDSLTARNLSDRRTADAMARRYRSRGHDVRVFQVGEGRG